MALSRIPFRIVCQFAISEAPTEKMVGLLVMAPTVVNVMAFNQQGFPLFASDSTSADAADLNIDISGSMAAAPQKERTLRGVVACMVQGTAAEGAFSIAAPNGRTAIIAAVAHSHQPTPTMLRLSSRTAKRTSMTRAKDCWCAKIRTGGGSPALSGGHNLSCVE